MVLVKMIENHTNINSLNNVFLSMTFSKWRIPTYEKGGGGGRVGIFIQHKEG